jgi:hypothetical protein
MADKSNPKELLKLRNRQSGYKEKLTLSALKEKSDKFKEPKWPLIKKKKSDPKLQAFPKKEMTKRKPTDVRTQVIDALSGGRRGKPHSSPEGREASAVRKLNRLKPIARAKGGRIGKQFGGGLPIQPTAGANLQPTVGANLQPPVGANPMGVADPSRRFGMKHGSKSKGGRTGLKHGGSAGAAKRGHGAEIK